MNTQEEPMEEDVTAPTAEPRTRSNAQSRDLALEHAKARASKPRSMRQGDYVRITKGVCKDKIGVISSIDKDRPPELRYFVTPVKSRSQDESGQVMGRFGSVELEIVPKRKLSARASRPKRKGKK